MDYFGDAIFADNGETHLYIGGPYTDDGTIQTGSAGGSIDFVSPAPLVDAEGLSVAKGRTAAAKPGLRAVAGVAEDPLET